MNATTAANDNARGSELSYPAANPASLSIPVLLKAMEEAKGIEARLRMQIEEMQGRLASTQEEAKILSKLIALRTGKAPEGSINEAVVVSPTALQNGAPLARTGHSVLEAVVAILEEANRPVHISDLMRLLDEKNVQIPGSGTQANLISYLRRDKRIVRPSRGMYGLVAWGLSEMPSQSKRRRRRRNAK